MVYDTLKAIPLPRINYTEKYGKEKAELEKEFQNHLDEWRQTALMMLSTAKKYGDRVEFHHRPNGEWETFTWNEISEIMFAVASALLNEGVGEEDKTGIFAPNRAEWTLADLGAQLIRCVPVPIYATNSEQEAEYIINDAEIRLLFVGRQAQYDRSYPLLDKCPSLKKIVVFHRGTKIHDDARVVMWDDFLAGGRPEKRRKEIEGIMERAHYDDVCTIIYTSGTTGAPKGVVHTHKTLMHNNWSVGRIVENEDGKGFPDTDATLAILPLSHVLERSWDYGVMSMGNQVWFCEDINEVAAYMKEANATSMNSVPRVSEKIYTAIFAGIKNAPPLKRKLFYWSLKMGKKHGDMVLAGVQPGPFLTLKRKIAGRLVLDKIRGIFGDNLRFLNYGGAPMNPEIEKFWFYCGLMCKSGYGLTETSPVLAMAGPHCFKLGTVGPAIPLVDIRIDPATGEIQAKGPNIFREYYKQPEKTREAFTEDGWFRTGDIGVFDGDGYLTITDRLKDVIITSGGKNVAPQSIEIMMAEDPYIEFMAVIGDKKKYLTALIVPSFDNLEVWARKNAIPFSGRDELITHPGVVAFYRRIIDKKQKNLGQVEQIKKFTLLPNEFSQETGEITPTMKIKRKVVQEKYKDLIERMYVEDAAQ